MIIEANRFLSRDAAGAARPLLLIGILAATAMTVLVASVLLRHNSAATVPEASSGAAAGASTAESTSSAAAGTGAQRGNAEAAQTRASAGPTAASGTTANPIAGTQVPVGDLIKALKDNSLPMSDRKAAILALAKLGTPETIAALKEALTGGPEEIRAAVAEGLGDCSSAECTALLLGLLADPSEAIVQAAVRGLAQLGSREAVGALTQLLNDPLRSLDVRSEAATGMGSINTPGAMQALAQAAMTVGEDDIATQVLKAIGGRDFTETQAFFRQYLGSGVSSDLRVAAIESLAQAKGNPIAFLAGFISDPDPELRASAAWAMSATDATGAAGPQLLAALQDEQNPEVRWRLYQALGNQDGFDTSTALALVQRETDPAARIAGMDLLASALRNNPTPAVQTYFDQTAAPALKNTALTGESSSERMAAVLALSHASTPAAMSALQELALQATDPRVQQSATKIVANPPAIMPKPGH